MVIPLYVIVRVGSRQRAASSVNASQSLFQVFSPITMSNMRGHCDLGGPALLFCLALRGQLIKIPTHDLALSRPALQAHANHATKEACP
jgi:hypothetical protein